MFSISEEYLAKRKSVLGRIVSLTFIRNGRSRKIVKLRILRIQSVESFGNPNLLIVEFFRLASIKAVFFFPIGICYSCFLFFSDWHLLKLFFPAVFTNKLKKCLFTLRLFFSGLLSKLETDR